MSKVVVLDAGHGGRDPGALGNKTQEKNNNLALVLKVGAILSQHGIIVKYTRTNDKDFCSGSFNDAIDLQNRIALAKTFNPDVFVSCHNDAFNKQAKGITTYCHKLGGTDEQLSKCIQGEHSNLPFQNRGVKTQNLYVTKKWDGTNTSACLIEYGFIDSEEDAILANMDKASIAISKGVLKFLGIQYKEDNTGGKYKVKNIVLVSHGVDERSAGYLADYLQCSIAFKGMISSSDLDQYENVYEVGGTQTYSRSVFLSGANRYDTCQKVLDRIAGK